MSMKSNMNEMFDLIESRNYNRMMEIKDLDGNLEKVVDKNEKETNLKFKQQEETINAKVKEVTTEADKKMILKKRVIKGLKETVASANPTPENPAQSEI